MTWPSSRSQQQQQTQKNPLHESATQPQTSQNWNRRSSNSSANLQRQYSQDLHQQHNSVASYFTASNAHNMTSQFNAAQAFGTPSNNNGDGWDDWGWNEDQQAANSMPNNNNKYVYQGNPFPAQNPPPQQFQGQFQQPPANQADAQNYNWNSWAASPAAPSQAPPSSVPPPMLNDYYAAQRPKPNPQLARVIKTDPSLTPQWSVDSQVSQTSSERSNESENSRSSATVTSDEGGTGFYAHQFAEKKANVVQNVQTVSESAVKPSSDMDKLDQALFEMNVMTNNNQPHNSWLLQSSTTPKPPSPMQQPVQATPPPPQGVQATPPVQQNFQVPPPVHQNYQAPPPVHQNYQAPPPQQQNFQALPPQQQNFQATPPQQQNFQGAPPQQQNFQAPPPPQQNFQTTPPPQQTYQATPPPPQQNFQPPPSQQNFQGPPPPQSVQAPPQSVQVPPPRPSVQATPPPTSQALPPPAFSNMSKTSGNPFKRSGQMQHHALNFQAPTSKLPSFMPNNFNNHHPEPPAASQNQESFFQPPQNNFQGFNPEFQQNLQYQGYESHNPQVREIPKPEFPPEPQANSFVEPPAPAPAFNQEEPPAVTEPVEHLNQEVVPQEQPDPYRPINVIQNVENQSVQQSDNARSRVESERSENSGSWGAWGDSPRNSPAPVATVAPVQHPAAPGPPVQHVMPLQQQVPASQIIAHNLHSSPHALAVGSSKPHHHSPRVVAPQNSPQRSNALHLSPNSSQSPLYHPSMPPQNHSTPLSLFQGTSTSFTHPPSPDPTPVPDFSSQETVHPNNDRNEYLQTGHLSEDNYNIPTASSSDRRSVEANDSLPPPGLSRYVPGQPESEPTQSTQEPPPGLDRMIPGTELENSTELNMAREADGQVSNLPPPVRRQAPNIEITDRNLYTVPGENLAEPRVVPGVEDDRSAAAPVPSIEPPVPEQEREVAVEGENLQDHRPGDPIEGADTFDEGPARGESESQLTQETTGRKETSTNDDSDRDRSYFRNKEGARKLPGGGTKKERYVSDESDFSEGEKKRYTREGSVKQDRARGRGEYREERRREEKEARRPREERDRRDRYDRDRKRYDQDESRYDRDRKSGRRHRRDDEEEELERLEKERRHRRKEEDEYVRGADRDRRHRRHRDERDRDDRRRKDDRDRDDRRRDRRDRYDYDYEFERGAGTRSERSHRDEKKYSSYYQQPAYPGYDPYTYYQQNQAYFEHLRVTNPQAYAEWYRSFCAQYQAQMSRDVTTDGRESVHSGRSSVHGEKDRYKMPIQQFYDPNYHRLNQSHSGHYMLDQSLPVGTGGGYVDAYLAGGGWAPSGPTSLIADAYPTFNNNGSTNSYFQPRMDPNTSLPPLSLNQTVEENLPPARTSPVKFGTSHCTASLSHGLLVSVKPRYSSNGFSDVVKIFSLSINDSTKRLFQVFPGPLVRPSTHKKSVIEFCEEQIRLGPFGAAIKSRGNSTSSIFSASSQASKASFSLIWSYLILLLRQNGTFVGTDISELLMQNKKEFPCDSPAQVVPKSLSSGRESTLSDVRESREPSPAPRSEEDSRRRSFDEEDEDEKSKKVALTETEVTEKFRNYLIYGNLAEALEWATENNLWGHALFLASKVDRRQHANVMMKFANKLLLNDPLQTLYQLMSGRTPSSVTMVAADDKFGDWRPHLAMILSNASDRPELNRKSIAVLGDSLYNKGDLFGAQFCWLLADIPFSKYADVNRESNLISNSPSAVRLVLLGSSQHKAFKEFATNEAIIMTEIYEYARTLNGEEFSIAELQLYKYLLATRILDYGMQLKTLLYMEQIACQIIKNPSKFEHNFIEKVYVLGERLKYSDPVIEKAVDEAGSPSSVEDQKWLQDLREVLNQYNAGALTYERSQSRDFSYMASTPQPSANNSHYQQPSVPPAIPESESLSHEFTQITQGINQLNLQYQPQQEEQPSSFVPQPSDQSQLDGTQYQWNQQPESYAQQPPQQQEEQYQQQTGEQQQGEQFQSNYNYGGQIYDPMSQGQAYSSGFESQQNSYDYWGQQQQQQQGNEEAPLPTISMPGTKNTKSYFDEDSHAPEGGKSQTGASKTEGQAKKMSPKDAGKQASSGWLGGIFSKITMKPKNQMILPEDKNPAIVWDPEKKRWINTEDGEDEQASFKPPPKMADLMGKTAQPQPVMMAPVPQQQVAPAPAPVAEPTPVVPMMAAPEAAAPNGQDANPTPRLQSNMFKLQRNRTLKKSYVDVFNPSGAPMSKPAETIMAPAQPSGPTPQTGFFVPGQVPQSNGQAEGAPQFYDPNQFTSYQQ